MTTGAAVAPTPHYLASVASSANYAMGCYPALKPDFPAMAMGAVIAQCTGNAPTPSAQVTEIGAATALRAPSGGIGIH